MTGTNSHHTAPRASTPRAGAVPSYQLALALALTGAAAVPLVWAASSIYRRALLITGHRVRLRELMWPRASRCLSALPGRAETAVEGIVFYHVVLPLLQPTTFGEPKGGVTERVQTLARVLKRAGFPTAVCPDMEAWQKTHVAWVSAMANGLYMAGGSGDAMASRPEVVRLTILAIREGFAVLRALGIPITPGKLRVFERIPCPSWPRPCVRGRTSSTSTRLPRGTHSPRSTRWRWCRRTSSHWPARPVPTPALDTLHAAPSDLDGRHGSLAWGE